MKAQKSPDLLRAQEVREAFMVFPGWAQTTISYFTGTPFKGQVLPPRNRALLVAQAALALIGGSALAILATATQAWVLLPIAWFMSASAARWAQIGVLHHGAHGNLFRKSGVDTWCGRIVALVLLIENFDEYRAAHMFEHHAAAALSSAIDPTVVFLTKMLGLAPGMSRRAAKFRIATQLLSPLFYARVFASRLERSNLLRGPWLLRPIAWTYLGGLFAGLLMPGIRPYVINTFVVPIAIVYTAAHAMRLVLEHRWQQKNTTARGRARIVELTPAITLGTPPPNTASLAAWVSWLPSVVGTVIVRYLILPADAVAHDLHHAEPLSSWVDFLAERALRRQAILDSGGIEIHGFWRALDDALDSFAAGNIPNAPPKSTKSNK